MKKIFFLLSAWIVTNTAFAQPGNYTKISSAAKRTFISTNSTKACYFNSNTGKYDDCTTSGESALLEMNAARTMFKLTISTGSFNYYVESSQYDKKYKLYVYRVVNDAGGKFTFVVPVKGNHISILKGTGANSFNLYLYIKRSWTE